jgi:integrase
MEGGSMRGSVIKKGDRWYVKIELDPDQATGKRHQKWHSGFNTKREAERARVDLLSKFDRGEYIEPSHQTVADFMVDWLKAIEPTVRPSTFESYERNMRNHVIAHIGAVRLTKVDAVFSMACTQRCWRPAAGLRLGWGRATRPRSPSLLASAGPRA